MSKKYIKTVFSTILVTMVFLGVVFNLNNQKWSLQLVGNYPNFRQNESNFSADRSQYHSMTVQRPIFRSYTRDIADKNMNMSTVKSEIIEKFRPSSPDSKPIIPSPQISHQNRSLKVTNNSWSSVSGLIPEELRRLRPMILNDFPSKFLPSYKNPCYIRYPEQRLHCLPYFFLLGTPKSGTTDIWSKIVSHPEIVATVKEPHWWTRRSYPSNPLSAYEQRYTNPIKKWTEANMTNKQLIVTGDGSASTFWDNSRWMTFYPEYNQTGPPYIVADVIHTVLPDAKLLVSLRDPTDRLYSGYVFFKPAGRTSPEDFHERVVTSIRRFRTCLAERPLEACAYSKNNQTVRLNIGIYSVYLRDWLRRYPRDQLMVLKLEEWHAHCPKLLSEIFDFLNVASLSPTHIAYICKKSSRNVTAKRKQIGPMLNSTRKILRDFYRPYVVKTASILNDDRFLWDYRDI